MSTDISYCANKTCTLKHKCVRSYPPNGYHWRGEFKQNPDGSCPDFILYHNNDTPVSSEDSPSQTDKAIEDKLEEIMTERGEDYGDFTLNMLACNKVLEAMLMQVLQQEVVLPDAFAARFFAMSKNIRQCHRHKKDNIDDRKNYDNQADEMDENASAYNDDGEW